MIQSFLIAGIVILPVLMIIMLSHMRRLKRVRIKMGEARCKNACEAMIADARLTFWLLIGMWLLYFGTYLVFYTDAVEVWAKVDSRTKIIVYSLSLAIITFYILFHFSEKFRSVYKAILSSLKTLYVFVIVCLLLLFNYISSIKLCRFFTKTFHKR